MQLLNSPEEIRAAIGVMNPTARIACQTFATAISANPQLLQDDRNLREALVDGMIFAMQVSGFDPDDQTRGRRFIEENHEAVFAVAVSILNVTMEQHETQKKWRWLGTAAAVGAGAALGAFFG